MDIEKLMELYRRYHNLKLSLEEMDNLRAEIFESFPELYERIRVAEKMVELMAGGLSFWNNKESEENINEYNRAAIALLSKEDSNGHWRN